MDIKKQHEWKHDYFFMGASWFECKKCGIAYAWDGTCAKKEPDKDDLRVEVFDTFVNLITDKNKSFRYDEGCKT